MSGTNPDHDDDPPAPPRRWPRRAGIALGVLLAAWGVVRFWPAPQGAGLSRPRAVSATALPQRDLTVDGVRIRYVDVGPRQAEVVIVLPGHTSRIEEYEAIVPTLMKRFRVVVFDFPGSGYSEKPEREYSLAYYEDTVVRVMDALGIERAHLAGGSQGANVLLGVAARYPERCLRLAPWSPGSAWPASPRIAAAGWLVAGYLPFWPVVKTQSTFWLRDDDPQAAAAIGATFDYYDEVMSPGFVAMYWGIALDTVRRSLFDLVGTIKHPTLLCWGGRDTTPYMAEGVARIAREMPRCELKRFEDAPHSLVAAVPAALGAAVLEFLTRAE